MLYSFRDNSVIIAILYELVMRTSCLSNELHVSMVWLAIYATCFLPVSPWRGDFVINPVIRWHYVLLGLWWTPSHRTSPFFLAHANLYWLVTEAHECEQLTHSRYMTAEWPGLEQNLCIRDRRSENTHTAMSTLHWHTLHDGTFSTEMLPKFTFTYLLTYLRMYGFTMTYLCG